jgi:hypothetical protein
MGYMLKEVKLAKRGRKAIRAGGFVLEGTLTPL